MFVLAMFVNPALLRGHFQLARALLAPSREAELARRVGPPHRDPARRRGHLGGRTAPHRAGLARRGAGPPGRHGHGPGHHRGARREGPGEGQAAPRDGPRRPPPRPWPSCATWCAASIRRSWPSADSPTPYGRWRCGCRCRPRCRWTCRSGPAPRRRSSRPRTSRSARLLTNAVKHAGATASGSTCRTRRARCGCSVGDNGKGGARDRGGRRPDRGRAAARYIRRRPGRQQPRGRSHHGDHGDPVRVVLAEDLFLLRDGLVRMLEAFDFEILAAVESGPELTRALAELDAGRRDRRRAAAAVAHRRGPPVRARRPPRPARPAGAGPVPARGAAVRARAPRRRHRRGRLPPQGPGVRRGAVRRRGTPGRGRRHRDGPAGHPAAAGRAARATEPLGGSRRASGR